MTVVLRPFGRGNWGTVILIKVGGRRAPPPVYFHKGQRVELGGQVFRVAEVRP